MSTSSTRCQASTCFCIGSKFRCMRSTPTEMQSINEKAFECLASTGVNTPETMLPSSDSALPSHALPSSRGRQRCFPCIAPGLQIAMVSNRERAPGVALGVHSHLCDLLTPTAHRIELQINSGDSAGKNRVFTIAHKMLPAVHSSVITVLKNTQGLRARVPVQQSWLESHGPDH